MAKNFQNFQLLPKQTKKRVKKDKNIEKTEEMRILGYHHSVGGQLCSISNQSKGDYYPHEMWSDHNKEM